VEEKFNVIGKYNFWDEKTIELGYYRSDYTDKIFAYTGNRLVKVLIGQRRTGKSYILRQLANKLIDNEIDRKNILYINKEYTDFDFIANYSDLDDFVKFYKKQFNISGKVCLFIDEIQNILGWEHFVNSYSQDFVALKDDKILYVQATYLMIDESTIEREYSPLELISDNYEKIVVSLDDIRFPQKNGIKHEQIWRFNPQKRLCKFASLSPARTFVKPPLV
jgi:predicted AAA+ superfamily ATPase